MSDSYDGTPWNQPTSRGFQMAGEIGLAANDTQPLMAPTEVASPRTEPAKLAARKTYNDAHMITLDDGANVDYSANDTQPFPWLTPTQTVRIGADVDFVKPVIFDFRNDLWKLQPQGRVAGAGTDYVTFEQDRPASPDPVGGNVRIATFNMLNYFIHPAQDWVADSTTPPLSTPGSNRTCSYYTARSTPSPAERLTANTCTWTDPRTTPPTLLSAGPRGAATATSLGRQEVKEVAAINTMDADVMSLEEVENPVKIGYADRDAALTRLVDALNADWNSAHAGQDPVVLGPRWAYAATPRPEAQPTIAEQDAIRAAFIYNPRVVQTVGTSEILVNSVPFRNAREPLAQAFKRVGASRDDAFIVIVNHFKSKGSSTETGDNVDLGDGAGAFNGDRRRQAAALDAFARQLADQKQIEPVFMTGDYNAYSNEDPVLDLEAKGWHELAPDNAEKTYSFGGLAGTLDHVFANDAAVGWVTGRTVWPINANESVYYEYSRFNNNVTSLYAANPFRSSDHNPEVIGINAPSTPPPPAVDTVQVLASNDFHGRLLDDPASASAGAASMAQAVKSMRAANPSTVFSMAGDIIGASTFESFIANDKPPIDSLNEAGLEVSAAGNHEFDRGYRDLLERVMDPTDPQGGVDWEYLAANVRLKAGGDYALASAARGNSNGASWWKVLPDGKTVGFVGAMTEDLPSLVSPDGIADIKVTDIVDEVNASADTLEADGADVIVLLIHEGAATTSLAAATDPNSAFGQVVNGVDTNIDAIVSGHTHLAYNHA
ncbi:ExeM/NucH family extracellular endonuclease, partial [Nocardioides sp.]|uniref:ExeM/NucH family extracellular endonuclease n=1 Tax=Nocardioides sp. TaxID=35761 RepID=UPI00286E13CF